MSVDPPMGDRPAVLFMIDGGTVHLISPVVEVVSISVNLPWLQPVSRSSRGREWAAANGADEPGSLCLPGNATKNGLGEGHDMT